MAVLPPMAGATCASTCRLVTAHAARSAVRHRPRVDHRVARPRRLAPVHASWRRTGPHTDSACVARACRSPVGTHGAIDGRAGSRERHRARAVVRESLDPRVRPRDEASSDSRESVCEPAGSRRTPRTSWVAAPTRCWRKWDAASAADGHRSGRAGRISPVRFHQRPACSSIPTRSPRCRAPASQRFCRGGEDGLASMPRCGAWLSRASTRSSGRPGRAGRRGGNARSRQARVVQADERGRAGGRRTALNCRAHARTSDQKRCSAIVACCTRGRSRSACACAAGFGARRRLCARIARAARGAARSSRAPLACRRSRSKTGQAMRHDRTAG